MRAPLRQASTWFAGFALWFGVLWWLSSAPRPMPEEIPFEVSDKLLHFGYFLGGAGLFTAGLLTRRPGIGAAACVALATGVVGLAGVLDEFHQSFVPGRSGNDPYDLAADVLGALAGSLACLPFRRLLAPPAAARAEIGG